MSLFTKSVLLSSGCFLWTPRSYFPDTEGSIHSCGWTQNGREGYRIKDSYLPEAFSDLFIERVGKIFSLVFLLITLKEIGKIDDSGTFFGSSCQS